MEIADIIGGWLLNAAIILVSGVIFVVIAGAVAFGVSRYRRYKEYVCIIWKVDTYGNKTQYRDDAGVFVDGRTKLKRFFMRRSNVGLNADNVPYVAGSGGKKYVYLVQTGLKNFHFVDVEVDYPEVTMQVGEEDVNWAVHAYERIKKTFADRMIMQLLPYLALVFVSVIIMIMVIYVVKNFDVLRDIAVELKEVARIIAEGRAGTTVIE